MANKVPAPKKQGKGKIKDGKKHKKNKRVDLQQEQELEVMESDQQARKEGPKKKTWSHLDMQTLRAANSNQAECIESWVNGDNLAMLGTAGTGKTLLSAYCASSVVFRRDEECDHIVIVRSAVQTRDLGFLPGTLDEKLAAYEQPYHDAFSWLFRRKATYEDMKEAGKISFLSTSFLRGVTLDNAVIILDEAQNLTFHELSTVLTRVGNNSRIIITGDTNQCDFDGKREASGLGIFREIVKDIRNFSVVEFTRNDIVRSGFVRSWITAVEQHAEKYNAHRK